MTILSNSVSDELLLSFRNFCYTRHGGGAHRVAASEMPATVAAGVAAGARGWRLYLSIEAKNSWKLTNGTFGNGSCRST